MFRALGFILSTLGSVPSNVFTVDLGTLNMFDGTDPKVDSVKPKVRNTIFFPVLYHMQPSSLVTKLTMALYPKESYLYECSHSYSGINLFHP